MNPNDRIIKLEFQKKEEEKKEKQPVQEGIKLSKEEQSKKID